jgi:hypothetical protein
MKRGSSELYNSHIIISLLAPSYLQCKRFPKGEHEFHGNIAFNISGGGDAVGQGHTLSIPISIERRGSGKVSQGWCVGIIR